MFSTGVMIRFAFGLGSPAVVYPFRKTASKLGSLAWFGSRLLTSKM